MVTIKVADIRRLLAAAFHKAIKARAAIAAMYRENIHRLTENIDRSVAGVLGSE